jgi:hypothetical protein
MRPVTRVTVAVVLASAALAVGAAYEAPRTFQAADLLTPAQVKGPHHQVAAEVPTEGYLHVFSIKTDYGPLEAEGVGMLLGRLHEVSALAELDQVSKSEVFVKAAGASVVNVGKSVAVAVTDPGATARGVGKGLKRFGTNLGRKAKRAGDQAADSVKDDGQKGEGSDKSTTEQVAAAGVGVAHSMLGVNAGARRWAQKVGADPYTTNAVLKKALVDIGKVDAAGGLAAKIAVPVPMVVSGTAAVGNLVWSRDPEELLKLNEQKLKETGVDDKTIKQLYLSRGFSLTLHTRLAAALGEVKVPGCADYVATAAEAEVEREAAFFVESAEMLARLHRTEPVAAILPDSRAMVAKTKEGRVVVLLPLDWIAWTESYAKALTEVETRAKKDLGATKLELRMTGTMSPAAKKEMAARAWKVVEKVPSTFDVVKARGTPAATS